MPNILAQLGFEKDSSSKPARWDVIGTFFLIGPYYFACRCFT